MRLLMGRGHKNTPCVHTAPQEEHIATQEKKTDGQESLNNQASPVKDEHLTNFNKYTIAIHDDIGTNQTSKPQTPHQNSFPAAGNPFPTAGNLSP